MSKIEERKELRRRVTRFSRLENSKSGNPRWELAFEDELSALRTCCDSHAGLEVTGIVDGIEDGEVDRGTTTPGAPVPVVLTLNGYHGLIGVRRDEEASR